MMDTQKMYRAASDMQIIGVELVKTLGRLELARYGTSQPQRHVTFPVEVAGRHYLIEAKEVSLAVVLAWMAEKAEKARDHGGSQDDR